jgi:hypothetical protein
MRKIQREYMQLCVVCGAALRDIQMRNGHYALYFDEGVVFAPGTPSDRRNRKNVAAQIRRLQRS